MLEIGWRHITRWYLTGTAIGTTVAGIWAAIHVMRFGVGSHDPGALGSTLMLTAYMLLGLLLMAPPFFMGTYSWTRLARKRNGWERSILIRSSALTLLALILSVAIVGEVELILWAAGALRPDASLYFSASALRDAMPFVLTVLAAVIAPRFLVSSLRPPLRWRS